MTVRRTLLGAVVSAGCLYLLLQALDLNAVLAALLASDPTYLAPALGLYFVGVWLRSLRWRYLLLPLKPVPVGVLFRTMIIGFTVNNLLPVRLGEVARAVALSRVSAVPAAATLGTILVERFFDGLTLCGLLALGLWLLPPGAGRPEWLLLVAQVSAAVFVGAVLGAWALAWWPERFLALADRGLVLAPARLRLRLRELLASFVRGLHSLRQATVVLPVAALSLGAWAFEAGMYYMVMLGFSLGTGPLAAMLGTAVANLGTMVPSSPGYVGTFDWPLQGVLTGVFGIAAAAATSYTLVVHAALLAPVVALGLFFLAGMGLSLRQVSRPLPVPLHPAPLVPGLGDGSAELRPAGGVSPAPGEAEVSRRT